MKKFLLVFKVLVAIYCIFGVHQSFSQAGWEIIGKGTEVQDNQKYFLKVAKKDDLLKYKDRKYGINLGWGSSSSLKSPNIKFVLKEGKGPIKCGDKVAIFVEGGGYLKYGKRKWGINIAWTQTPRYEWELRTANNEKGETIKTNEVIAIAHSTDFMVHCVRKASPTVDLGWFSDCGTDGTRWPKGLNNFKPEIALIIKHKSKLLLLL